jgi:tetratricopeptide (TPR) repeat protein
MGRYDEALTDFNQIIELNPKDQWAIASRGETYRLMGRYDEALTDFNQAIALWPETDWIVAERGESYQSSSPEVMRDR